MQKLIRQGIYLLALFTGGIVRFDRRKQISVYNHSAVTSPTEWYFAVPTAFQHVSRLRHLLHSQCKLPEFFSSNSHFIFEFFRCKSYIQFSYLGRTLLIINLDSFALQQKFFAVGPHVFNSHVEVSVAPPVHAYTLAFDSGQIFASWVTADHHYIVDPELVLQIFEGQKLTDSHFLDLIYLLLEVFLQKLYESDFLLLVVLLALLLLNFHEGFPLRQDEDQHCFGILSFALRLEELFGCD